MSQTAGLLCIFNVSITRVEYRSAYDPYFTELLSVIAVLYIRIPCVLRSTRNALVRPCERDILTDPRSHRVYCIYWTKSVRIDDRSERYLYERIDRVSYAFCICGTIAVCLRWWFIGRREAVKEGILWLYNNRSISFIRRFIREIVVVSQMFRKIMGMRSRLFELCALIDRIKIRFYRSLNPILVAI